MPYTTSIIVKRFFAALLCSSAFTACDVIPDITESRSITLTKAQNCAIGYDLARQIYERISLREVVIIAPKRQNSCEQHSLKYLKLAGFKIDETRGAENFDITISPAEGTSVTAVATVGRGLKIARSYKPAATGVHPVTDVSVQITSPIYEE